MTQNGLYRMGQMTMRWYSRLLLKADVRHHSADLPPGAKIIAPNHPTTIDPFLTTVFFGERLHILVTESAFKAPVFGRYLRATGHVEVVASEGGQAFDAAHTLLQAGRTVVIFPEGALSPLDGSLPHARTGVVRLAALTGAPVIPVGIGLLPERIRHIRTGIIDERGQEEIARVYLRAPYGVTSGPPMFFTGNVDDHDWVRSESRRLMRQIMRLSQQSAYRIGAQAPVFSRTDTAEIPSL